MIAMIAFIGGFAVGVMVVICAALMVAEGEDDEDIT